MANPFPGQQPEGVENTLNWESLGGLMPLGLKSIVQSSGTFTKGIAFGFATVTFPGAQSFADNTTIAHGLGATPVVALATSNQVFEVQCVVESLSGSFTASNVAFRVETRDGSNPALGVVKGFHWLAVA